jgi:hypothetical protein
MLNIRFRWLISFLLTFGLFAPLGLSQPAATNEIEDQEYGSTYARVRHLEGEVSLQRTREGEILAAGMNAPLESGDRAWTDRGRVEIELADGAIVWLDESTRLELRSLSDVANRYENTNLLALIEGSLRVDLQDPVDSDAVFQIDTEGGSIYLLSAGSFRIDAEGGVATLSSFRGVAELSGDSGSVLVRSGERGSVQVGGRPSDPRPFNTLRLDDFDSFHDERVEAYLRRGGGPIGEIEESVPQEVRPYVLELSVYGGWHHHGTYGWVWRPAYHGGWGPYVDGRWVYYPTGWVWVSYDPWGWAPYHYGRWDYGVDLGWVWIPGARWSGAWVSFAVGSSYIGWCPLNYYNYPVFHDAHFRSRVSVRAAHLHHRGWRFAKAGVFGAVHGRGSVLPANRLPRGTDLVITGGLPRFNPKRVGNHQKSRRDFVNSVRESRVPLPGTVSRGRSESFRRLEKRMARTGGRGVGRDRHSDLDRGSHRSRPSAKAPGGRSGAAPTPVITPSGRRAEPGERRKTSYRGRTARTPRSGLPSATGGRRDSSPGKNFRTPRAGSRGPVAGGKTKARGSSGRAGKAGASAAGKSGVIKRSPGSRDHVVNRLVRGIKRDRARVRSTQSGSKGRSRSAQVGSRGRSGSSKSSKKMTQGRSGSPKASKAKSGARGKSSRSSSGKPKSKRPCRARFS